MTVEPTFTSPLVFMVGSRSISNRSVPFCTVILLPVISSTVPVTWYVFAPAANIVALNARVTIASKQIIFGFINRDKPVQAATQVFNGMSPKPGEAGQLLQSERGGSLLDLKRRSWATQLIV